MMRLFAFVTIHELSNKVHARFAEVPTEKLLKWHSFPPEDTELLVSPDEKLVIAINRVTGMYAAQRQWFIVVGRDDADLLEA